MDTLRAFAMGEANRNKPERVFDWVKAAKLIKENKPDSASAGLSGDWEFTGGEIYSDGKPLSCEDSMLFLSSTWATPELEMDGLRQDCWIWKSDSPGWGASTFWPEEALAIINGV